MRVIGLIAITDQAAFDLYRSQVGATIARYGGKVLFRGATAMMPWNELACGKFDACVEIDFPTSDHARQWAESPEYAALLEIRSRAMRLTLFGAE